MPGKGYIFDTGAARLVSRATKRVLRPGGVNTTGDALAVDAAPRRRTSVFLPTEAQGAAQFQITGLALDFVVARRISPQTDEIIGDQVNIAKPYNLQFSPFDGQTIDYGDQQIAYSDYNVGANNRTATSGATVEDQAVTPSWYVGDRIIAVRMASRVGLPGAGGNPLLWMDINAAGRMWAKVPEEAGA